jgi:hypothetical protein
VNKGSTPIHYMPSLKGWGRLFTADDKRSLERRESYEYRRRGLLWSFE